MEGIKLSVGDTVMIRSGGPVMVVSSIADDGEVVNCKWMCGNSLYSECFAVDALKKDE